MKNRSRNNDVFINCTLSLYFTFHCTFTVTLLFSTLSLLNSTLLYHPVQCTLYTLQYHVTELYATGHNTFLFITMLLYFTLQYTVTFVYNPLLLLFTLLSCTIRGYFRIHCYLCVQYIVTNVYDKLLLLRSLHLHSCS